MRSWTIQQPESPPAFAAAAAFSMVASQCVFVGFPAEGDAGAAVFVAGLEDEVFALFADEGEQVDRLVVVRGAARRRRRESTGRGADEFAFVVRKRARRCVRR